MSTCAICLDFLLTEPDILSFWLFLSYKLRLSRGVRTHPILLRQTDFKYIHIMAGINESKQFSSSEERASQLAIFIFSHPEQTKR